ncbi:MAG: family 78 glycoside hydrolase catalytic domain [Butyrivibrio sp.]|nr:family 78 glycoside hydrolase catalytic domain [Butyrivibrio sp.]
MLQIKKFTVEELDRGCVTDSENPVFAWNYDSDRNGTTIVSQKLVIGDYEKEILSDGSYTYDGPGLSSMREYTAKLIAMADNGDIAEKSISFATGKMHDPWSGQFITDGDYVFKEKKISPKVMVFRKKFETDKKVSKAVIYSTAIGMYRLDLNGSKVGEDFLTPGFTSYKTNLQYQTYDVTDMLKETNTLFATLSGGWAVGSFVFSRVNRVTADKQSFLCELHIFFEDGTKEVIATDTSWEVATNGPVLSADIYDGEEYDARIGEGEMSFKKASVYDLRFAPSIKAQYGLPVREHETFEAVSIRTAWDEIIYDFGQNFAGLVHLEIDGREGEEITVRHAEVLHPDGRLNTDFLRSAKARIRYICKDGHQEYCPSFTYMGFRYVSVRGISAERIKVTARALYSDVKDNGSFTCSNEMINRLQENIRWGAKSNFVDIPTDCPQRDERMGWTGDIALFANTAVYNYDCGRFLKKWLKDMRAEQRVTGGIPNTIPSQGYGFPVTMPVMAVDFWGDASVLVPYAQYMADGDEKILTDNYEMMKKYVNACRFWAGFLSFGKRRHLWNTMSVLHFGDWVAPDVPKMSQWQKRSKWTATASLSNTSRLLSEIAGILGKSEDEALYKKVSENAADAYRKYLTDGNGRLKEEFQTAYVLPIYFGMFKGKEKVNAADNLAELVRKNDYKIGTGFPGTPYILFALADNGHEDEAFKMLTNTQCPSWLYEVKMGATTIWERWDGLDESGNCPIGDDGTETMISYNHYASGAVGDFLYRRVAGIEAVTAGYKSFKIKPVIGGGITSASGKVSTPYGEIDSTWKISGDVFSIEVHVPVGSTCQLFLPDRSIHPLENGHHTFTCKMSPRDGVKGSLLSPGDGVKGSF